MSDAICVKKVARSFVLWYKLIARSFVYLPSLSSPTKGLPMTPADITGSSELRVGLVRRLFEVGLIPPEQADLRIAPLPTAPVARAEEDRKAA
jgi:hypothetical protein